MFPNGQTPQFNELIAAAKIEPNPKKAPRYFERCRTVIMEEVPFIAVSSDEFMFGHNSQLKGYVFDCVGACDFSRASLEAPLKEALLN